MPTKRVIISNTIICCVLLVLTYLTLNLDVGKTYLTVSAPVSNGNRASNQVALMFIVDDPATVDNLSTIMSTLTNAQVQATFFIAGQIIPQHLDVIQPLGQQFELGNYGFNGTALNLADKQTITDQIALCDAIITKFAKQPVRYFTPPAELFNKNTLAMAEQLGYRTILPTNRKITLNWQTANTSLITAYATQDTQAGDIVLLHPTTATTQVLAQIIATFSMRDLHVTSVGQLLSA